MIARSGAHVKDMEAAAIAWVASLLDIPFLGVKSITDLVDGAHPTADQFTQNLCHAVGRLAGVMPRLLDALSRPGSA
jgi:nucleoside phosphorylase